MYAFNRNNPFLDMLAALDEAGTQTSPFNEQQDANSIGGRVQEVKLPEFWPHAPALWFSRAECMFTLHSVTDDVLKYCSVVASLPHDVLRQVADLLDITKLARPYDQLKERLMAAYELTPVQRAERVMQMPDLGSQRPSRLLVAMLEWCPRGEETSSFFIASFLRRLPNELRVLLAHDDFTDLKALSQKADALWQLCPRADPLAAISEVADEAAGPIAGVGQRSAKGRSAGYTAKKKSSGGKKNIVYCWKHHQFGDKAHSCADPATCMWAAEN
jgi:hypothetical protein